MNHWHPVLYGNRNLVPASTDPNYHLTTDLADQAIAWARKVKSIAPETGRASCTSAPAAHSPHHAPQDWRRQVQGQVRPWLGQVARETFARQKKLGVIPRSTKLTPRPQGISRVGFDQPADAKRVYTRLMENYAALPGATPTTRSAA